MAAFRFNIRLTIYFVWTLSQDLDSSGKFDHRRFPLQPCILDEGACLVLMAHQFMCYLLRFSSFAELNIMRESQHSELAVFTFRV